MSKEIQLTLGLTALVDDEDYKRLSDGYKWQARYNSDGIKVYASRTRDKKTEIMHRIILKITDRSLHVDHINGDGLDNRKENLRICDRAKNGQNRIKHKMGTSNFKGVSWHKRSEKWQSRITIDKKTKNLGSFDSEIDAATAYNEAALLHFGEFALLNKL